MEDRPVIFWDTREAEGLKFSTLDEFITHTLEGFDEGEYPKTVEAQGYARMVVEWDFKSPLDDLLESLDDEYGGEDGTDKTEAMIEAEKAFLAIMEKEYTPWACEIVTHQTVNIPEWLAAHKAAKDA